jgi:hypothetical protein
MVRHVRIAQAGPLVRPAGEAAGDAAVCDRGRSQDLCAREARRRAHRLRGHINPQFPKQLIVSSEIPEWLEAASAEKISIKG